MLNWSSPTTFPRYSSVHDSSEAENWRPILKRVGVITHFVMLMTVFERNRHTIDIWLLLTYNGK